MPIESFIYSRGVTRCPPRYAGSVFGALPRETEMALLAAIKLPERGLTYTQQRDNFFARLRGASDARTLVGHN